MTINEVIRNLPAFTFIVGGAWLRKSKWCSVEYISERLAQYERLERDLTTLEAAAGQRALCKNYRWLLRDRNSFWTTLHEIHAIALVSRISSNVELKVPVGRFSNNDFDARAFIDGTFVNLECKTRKDEYPFNLPPISTEDRNHAVPIYSGSRATVDRNDAAILGVEFPEPVNDPLFVSTPESTVVRQILFDAVRQQLPQSGCNLIALGQIDGMKRATEQALFGSPIWGIKNRQVFDVRTQTGAFCSGDSGAPFRYLSGVLWFQLNCIPGPDYVLYNNPNAVCPLPKLVCQKLEQLINGARGT